MRLWMLGLLGLAGCIGSALAGEALAFSAGFLSTADRISYFADGPHLTLGFSVLEPRVLTPYTSADLALSLAADLAAHRGTIDDGPPPEWYRIGRMRDRWLASSQAARVFVEPLPALGFGIGLGLHEILPIESPPGEHGNHQRSHFEEIYYQWRRHLVLRIDTHPRGRQALLLEFEHQRALRRADYYGEPRAAYVFTLGYRFY